MELGKLTKVDLRKVWKNEALDFTTWLALPENMEQLGDVLGLTLVDVSTEQSVGGYRCDIVCRDEITKKTVIIENQLEQSNHDHLGKIITYASGMDAAVVVWIVADARDEHASAIEWLNKHSDESVSFFLLQIEAYRIGDSLPAPRFNVIEQPNDFSRILKKDQTKDMGETESDWLEFWELFNDEIEKRGNPFKTRKAVAQHWYDVAIGSSQCHISATLVNSENVARVEVYIDDNKDLFDHFLQHRDEIEKTIGKQLSWNRLDGKKASRIVVDAAELDFSDKKNYKKIMDDLIDMIVKFQKAFKPFLND